MFIKGQDIERIFKDLLQDLSEDGAPLETFDKLRDHIALMNACRWGSENKPKTYHCRNAPFNRGYEKNPEPLGLYSWKTDCTSNKSGLIG